MTHLDLFSGIGGFAYAVDQVWPGSEHIFCEIDPYCQALLRQRFPGSVIHGDIRQLTANTQSGHSEQQDIKIQTGRDAISSRHIDILTGGFPCQPFSCAGKRRGTEDNRYLWPEMLRVIRDFKPTWVIAENVRGLLTIEQGMVFEQVCLDLEREGYEVQPFIIPAVAVNAPHRRDRVWIVANRKSSRCLPGGNSSEGSTNCGEHPTEDRQQRQRQGSGIIPDSSNARDPVGKRLERNSRWRSGEELKDGFERIRSDWSWNWLEVATELCGVDDGLPAELDGLKFTKAGHRVARLKALGNSIVPQVAIEIMEAIKSTTPTPTQKGQR